MARQIWVRRSLEPKTLCILVLNRSVDYFKIIDVHKGDSIVMNLNSRSLYQKIILEIDTDLSLFDTMDTLCNVYKSNV